MDYNTNTLLNDELLTIVLVTVIGCFLILAFFMNFYLPFREKRNYFKMEMKRSYKESEYRYWKKRLKRLYLRSIPLIGRFFR